MRRDAHRTGDVLAGREGERLVAEEVADSERIVAHGELGEFTGGPPKAIAHRRGRRNRQATEATEALVALDAADRTQHGWSASPEPVPADGPR